MAVRSLRVLAAYLRGANPRQREAAQTRPPCIALEPRAGMAPSDQPAVRIFVGTESAQFRAERAFVYSIERVRDPARRYLIYLMKDFAGFERRLWLTGFTNYRFAIPELAGGSGRAIYNDADQIYLADPARLFDTPMGECGVLSINDRDTSVMLIDCARMRDLWNWRSATTTRNRELEARMRAANLWGGLAGQWNARDEEYDPKRSLLVHYTTIHTQPWRPFPGDYVYRANPAAGIWNAIEREADAAGFQLFDAARPSPELAAGNAAGGHAPPPARLADYRRALAAATPASVYYCGYDSGATIGALVASGVTLETGAPEADVDRPMPNARCDLVLADGLEQLPDLDLPWILERLFARAAKAVVVSVDMATAARRTPADALWWYAQMASAGARHPRHHWRLAVRGRGLARNRAAFWAGGALLAVPPATWVLAHYKTGHRSQAIGLAEALGWPYAGKPLAATPVRYAVAALRGRLPGAHPALSGEIRPPWPNVVVASGWLPGVVARWIARQNHGATRLILLGRRGGPVAETQDIAVVCRHFGVPAHPRQIETVLPPCKVGGRALARAARQWPAPLGDAPRPHVVLLAGGRSKQAELDAPSASRLAGAVAGEAAALGGALAVLTSRRTPAASAAALRAATGERARFEPWRPDAGRANPYLGYLADADILVVTGESESMLAEAVATGKPVYIAPLAARARGVRQRLADWVVSQAATDRFNARGSRRPQQGLQYLCARLVEKRVLLARRDMGALHRALVEQGVARIFDGELRPFEPPAWHETQWLAQRIRALLPAAGAASARDPAGDAARDGDRVVSV